MFGKLVSLNWRGTWLQRFWQTHANQSRFHEDLTTSQKTPASILHQKENCCRRWSCANCNDESRFSKLKVCFRFIAYLLCDTRLVSTLESIYLSVFKTRPVIGVNPGTQQRHFLNRFLFMINLFWRFHYIRIRLFEMKRRRWKTFIGNCPKL